MLKSEREGVVWIWPIQHATGADAFYFEQGLRGYVLPDNSMVSNIAIDGDPIVTLTGRVFKKDYGLVARVFGSSESSIGFEVRINDVNYLVSDGDLHEIVIDRLDGRCLL